MMDVRCELDGTPAAESAARRALAEAARGDSVALVGVVSEPRLGPPAPAVGDRIRRFQRVEGQLLRLARAAEAGEATVTVALPGREPVELRTLEYAAMRAAA